MARAGIAGKGEESGRTAHSILWGAKGGLSTAQSALLRRRGMHAGEQKVSSIARLQQCDARLPCWPKARHKHSSAWTPRVQAASAQADAPSACMANSGTHNTWRQPGTTSNGVLPASQAPRQPHTALNEVVVLLNYYYLLLNEVVMK